MADWHTVPMGLTWLIAMTEAYASLRSNVNSHIVYQYTKFAMTLKIVFLEKMKMNHCALLIALVRVCSDVVGELHPSSKAL